MPHFWDRAQGTTMRHIKRSALTEVQTVVPSQDLVLEFSDAVGPLDAEALTLRFQTAELSTLRDLLLPKLVSGQIDVSTLDLDALLETVA